jgi:post-segregation antitoxin (ccd killing protein)
MIIGLSGYARTGKDTVANILVEQHGFTKLAFADPMREALLRLNPFIEVNDIQHMPLDQALRVYSWEDLKSESPDIRGLMQRIGTEVGRQMFGENVWVDLAMKEAAKYENVVFSDVRFLNEADALRNAGGSIWRIERPGIEAANDHISETGLDDYSFNAVLSNDRGTEELVDTVASGIEFEHLLDSLKRG